MTQTYKKLLEKKSQEIKETENNEILGDLNPKYFEEAYTPKEAKIRATASRISPDSNNIFFGGW